MSLSSDLVSQFVKVTKDDGNVKQESTHYGTTVEYNGTMYVKLDGSELLTPVSTTADVKSGERVTVTIKNHSATVTGNMSSPAARTEDVADIAGDVAEISDDIAEFENVIAYTVTTEDLEAVNATIDSLVAKAASINKLSVVEADIYELQAKFASLDQVTAKDVEILNAEIEKLEAKFGTFTDVETEDLEAIEAEITNLYGYTADFTYVSADILSAIKATITDLEVRGTARIKELETEKLSAEQADLKYANIDFSNIGEATMQSFYAKSGLIEDVTVSNGTITGHLIGVTINADSITTGSLKADRLVIKGDDGLYYKLNVEAGAVASEEVTEEELQNGLHGTAIIAKTITAEKISVDDLVAFDATIGGFNITDDSLYSGVKSSADNTTRGIYLDKEGQLVAGDETNFIKYYKDTDGQYKLAISASSVVISTSNKDLETVLTEAEKAANTVKELEEKVEAGNFSGEDAYSVVLSSESHTFPGSVSAALAGSTSTQVVALKGSELTAATVNQSEITKPDGVTVSLSNNNTAPIVTISVTDAVTSGGSVVIPVHVGNITINKEFTFAIAFTGAQGEKGEKGETGEQGPQGIQGEKGDTGEQGIQGEKGDTGADGRAQYVHIKYSDDGETFTADDGETLGAWIGTLVDFNELDSTTFSDYTWKKFTEDVDEELEALETRIVHQEATIATTCEGIVAEAVKECVTTGEYTEYKQNLETRLETLSDGVNISISNTEEINDLKESDTQLEDRIKLLETYFRFTADGQYIGSSDSEMQTRFANDMWEFLLNGVQRLYIDPYGVHTDSLHIGDLIFQEQSDGSVIIS